MHEWEHLPNEGEDDRSESQDKGQTGSGSAAIEDPVGRQARVRRLLNDGARMLKAGRLGEAADRLLQARELEPKNAAIAINLGGAYVMQGKWRKAVSVLEEATELEPDNPMVWTNLAAAYLGRLKFSSRRAQDRAIGAFEKALQLDPDAPNVNYNLGLIYKERGDIHRASAHFWRALEVDPNDEDARMWLRTMKNPGEEDPDQNKPAGHG